MDLETEHNTHERMQLRACIRDLGGVLALAGAWTGHEPWRMRSKLA